MIGIIINNRSLTQTLCRAPRLSVRPSLSIFLSLAVPSGVYNFTFVCCFLERPREKRRTIILYCTEIHFTALYNLLRFIAGTLKSGRYTVRPETRVLWARWNISCDTDDEAVRWLKNVYKLNLLKIPGGMKCVIYGDNNISVRSGRHRCSHISLDARTGIGRVRKVMQCDGHG